MDHSHKLYKGAMVWVKHPVEAWTPATVCDILNKSEIQVLFPDGNMKSIEITPENPVPRHVYSDDGNATLEGTLTEEVYHTGVIDDLTKIPQIITPAVLHLLRAAYMREQYYCKLGSGTLLALNPFKEVPNLVSAEKVWSYSSSSLKELQDLPAHIYTIAQNAYAAVQSRTGRINQSIIVSGESGAGKTRTVGCLMRFLAEVEETRDVSYPYQATGRQFNLNSHNNVNAACIQPNQLGTMTEVSQTTCDSGHRGIVQTSLKSGTTDVLDREFLSARGHVIVDNIEKRVLNSNPVLEAFGNAQTTRNNNSSRFGKYIQLQYSRSGFLIGANLKTYLLEKTRVVHHDRGERCYHIFYQMLYGSSLKQQAEWKLLCDPFSEGMEAASDEMHMEHKLNFANTVKAMKKLGISENMQDRIFKVLSAILHLRQLNFEGPDDLQTPCNIHHDNTDRSGCLRIASELLGLDEQTIKNVITFRRISSQSGKKKSIFLRPSTVRECQIRRDCLLKFIYQILFEWIVRGVQERIRSVNSENCSFLGLLDVYGFESFESNSLEQLCINFANEKLHHHFCTTFIKNLQEECCHEGVQDASCDLGRTEGCLLALEAPRISLFSLLNEECRLNRANAECNLISRIESVFSENGHIKLPRISSAASCFTVSHFAGNVSYNTEFLIEKNKDEVPAEFIETLAMSKNGFVRQLVSYCQNMMAELDNSASNDGKHEHPRHAKPVPTVLMRFKKSLDELLGILSNTDRHYIRCIKPNKESQPKVFDAQFVLSQMEACGIVDTIRVCSSVYSCRMSYEQFHARYFFLARDSKLSEQFSQESATGTEHQSSLHSLLMKERCSAILKSIRIKGESVADDMMQFGKTKVFLSTELFEQLEFLRSAEIFNRCVIIQSAWRVYSHKKKCRAERKLMIANRVAAAAVLQKSWRNKLNVKMCRLQRKCIISIRKKCVTVIESAWISYSMRKKARAYRQKMRLDRSAIKVQACFRGWRVRHQYKVLLAVQLQRKVQQRVKLSNLDIDSSTFSNPCSSQDLTHSETTPHVPYFELVSNSSANVITTTVHSKTLSNKLANYPDKFGTIPSPPACLAQGDATRILLLDHQDVPAIHSSLNRKGGSPVSPVSEYNRGSSSNSYKPKQSPRTPRTRNPVEDITLSHSFDILQWVSGDLAMASTWHRLPSVCVMTHFKSFTLRFCRISPKNQSFIFNCGSSSILKYADVRPRE